MRTRLRVAWLAIVAFLPLYAVVGTVLRERGEAVEGDRGPALLLAAVFAVLALVLRPLSIRGGLHPAPAHLVAWAAAEAVAICGLVAWVESGNPLDYAVAAALSFVLLVALFPRLPDPG